ncbi:hypothetical protein S40288_04065 [Stachybotrys chartarum IBT 40288]|nr:hypothetical protein S40288_04065 [Stachybotrys chartarum IBT 40288]
MNSAYHPSDMSQSMPLQAGAGYAPAPPHHYQQQQHQHAHQPQRHQPPTQLQHTLSRQQPSSTAHHHSLPQPPPPPHQLSHPPASHPAANSHHAQLSSGSNQASRTYETSPQLSAEDPAQSQEMMAPMSKVDEGTGRKYYLDVVQQPRRARMCGFGDKDRRPITPPPCVRLVITDISTGKEIDCNDIDHSMFVLNVDLWSEDGKREVNLVRSSGGNPAISSTTPFSYSTLNGGDGNSMPFAQQMIQPGRDGGYPGAPGPVGYVQDYQVQQGYGQGKCSCNDMRSKLSMLTVLEAPMAPSYAQNGSYGPPQQYFPQHQGSYRGDPGVSGLPSQSNMAAMNRSGAPASFGTGMFTRNLIGSLAASAFRLQDCDDRIGIWFVLQDLSVRTEGTFRLRFSFVNVGPRSGAPREPSTAKVNMGRAPILASCFSESFMVYSAKKFPGVCESTALSKTFAGQGIKIPIRKDGSGKGGEDDDDAD